MPLEKTASAARWTLLWSLCLANTFVDASNVGSKSDALVLSYESGLLGRVAALGDWNGDHW